MSDDLALPALSLRCRDAEWVDLPETLAAFQRPSPPPQLYRDFALTELLLTDRAARRWAGLEGVGPVLSCETPRYGTIDTLGRGLDGLPISDWTDEGDLYGDLILEPEPSDAPGQPGLLRGRVRRGLVALAAVLPMLSVSVAEAAPPTDAPTVAPPVEGPTQPPVVAPATTPDDSLSLSGRNLWEGLKDQRLVLGLEDGTQLAGTVVAQSSSDLAFSRASDGTVVAVPKADVAAIRVYEGPTSASAKPAGKDGSGGIIAGAVLLAGGSAFALAGAIALGVYPSALYFSLPALVPGLAMVGLGIPLLAKGIKRRNEAERRMRGWSKLELSPAFGANRRGGQLGLVLRF